MSHEISTFDNGLKVLAVPLKERKSVSIGIWVHVGSRNESPAFGGVSHFLEHIVFKGTPSRTAAKIKESIEGVGGSMNAFTSEECTCFLAKTTRRHFDSVFNTLSDMTLNASLDAKDIEKERTVILEEIKMTQDQPSQLVDEILSGIVWPNHVLGRPIAGTDKTVSALTRQNIKDYRDDYYAPHYITVTAAGDIDQKTLTEASAKLFSEKKPKKEKQLELFRPTQSRPAISLFSKETEQTHLALSLHAPPKDHPDEYAVELLSVILGGNMSSRLFNEVREERGLAYDIGSFVRRYQETGAFVVSAGVDHKKAKDALSVILAELERVTREPVKADELGRAQEFYLGQFELGLENSMSQMLWNGENLMSLGHLRDPEEIVKKVRKVTAEDVIRVASGIFKTTALNLAMVGPSLSEKDYSAILAFSKK